MTALTQHYERLLFSVMETGVDGALVAVRRADALHTTSVIAVGKAMTSLRTSSCSAMSAMASFTTATAFRSSLLRGFFSPASAVPARPDWSCIEECSEAMSPTTDSVTPRCCAE